jgi:sialate O-acetylesterase
MIAPIGTYGFRGVLWYQGESNTFEAARYAGDLGDLIADWRQRFASQLPWLNVQLAGYGWPPTQPVESGWAELREVQRRYAEKDSRYGIATAVDIGDRYDIHPPNKQELGRRLSRLARHLIYGEQDVSPSGPAPSRAERIGDHVQVHFDGVAGGLVSLGLSSPLGFELCAAAADTCRAVEAEIHGEGVRLAVPADLSPTRVRHAWADSPLITLFDREHQPVLPFEIPIPPTEQP